MFESSGNRHYSRLQKIVNSHKQPPTTPPQAKHVQPPTEKKSAPKATPKPSRQTLSRSEFDSKVDAKLKNLNINFDDLMNKIAEKYGITSDAVPTPEAKHVKKSGESASSAKQAPTKRRTKKQAPAEITRV